MNKNFTKIIFFKLLLLLSFDSFAQGYLIPVHKNIQILPKLLSHKAEIEITDLVADVKIEQVFYNPGKITFEGEYFYAIPENIDTTETAVFIHGKKHAANILDRDEAFKSVYKYFEITNDPTLFALSEQKLLCTKINPIKSRKKLKVILRYKQNLKLINGMARLIYPLCSELNDVYSKQSNPEPNLQRANKSQTSRCAELINIKIQSDKPVQNIYSPTHKIELIQNEDNKAEIHYTGYQDIDARDFVLYYSFADNDHDFSLNLITQHLNSNTDGYFMLLVSPKAKIPSYKMLNKDIIFVVDVSVSMAGDKLKNVKEALIYCISNLGRNDYFNIVTFSNEVKLFEKKLVKAGDYKKKALNFIKNIRAKGGSNINEALLTALDITEIKSHFRSIIFITDGRPTVGLKDINTIRKNVKRLNRNKYRIYSFGIGNEINTHLLDGIALDSHGQSNYMEPSSDINLSISSFYTKISNPILLDLGLEFSDVEVTEIYPKATSNLYKNSQLILVGRYKNSGNTSLKLSGISANQRETFEYLVTFDSIQKENSFLPRIWAARKIGYILEHLKLDEQIEIKQFYLSEIAAISKKYGFVTPNMKEFIYDDKNLQLSSLKYQPNKNIFKDFYDSLETDSNLLVDVGEFAVAYSKTTQNLKDAAVSDLINNFQKIRYVHDRSFIRNENGYWIDFNLDSSKKLLNVKYASEAYFELIKKYPAVRRFVSLGKKVLFQFKDKIIKIDDQGLDYLPATLSK